MDDDAWRADGSFRGMSTSDGGGKGRGKGRQGGGPQFTRVIPKFLQKYHEPPAIMAKFATPTGPSGGDGDGDGEDEDDALDEVQQAAMDEYLKQKQEKLERKADSEDSRKRKPTQAMAHMGRKTTTSKPSKDTDEKGSSTTESDKPQTKRKKTAKAVNNRSLLSFSMDDDA